MTYNFHKNDDVINFIDKYFVEICYQIIHQLSLQEKPTLLELFVFIYVVNPYLF